LRWSSTYGWGALPIAIELFLSRDIMSLSCLSELHLCLFTKSILNNSSCIWTVGKHIAILQLSKEDFLDSESSLLLFPETMLVRYYIVLDVNGLLCNAENRSRGQINWRRGMEDFL
jgi:hypothetical protein